MATKGCMGRQKTGALLLALVLASSVFSSKVAAWSLRTQIFSGCDWKHIRYTKSAITGSLGLSESDEYLGGQYQGPGLDTMIKSCRFVNEVSNDGTRYRDVVKWWNVIDGLTSDPKVKALWIGVFWKLELAIVKMCGRDDVGWEVAGTLPMGLGGTIGILRKIVTTMFAAEESADAARRVPVAPVKAGAGFLKKVVEKMKKPFKKGKDWMEDVCPKGKWPLRVFRGVYKIWGMSKMAISVIDQLLLPSIAAGYCSEMTSRFDHYMQMHPDVKPYDGPVTGCDPLPEGFNTSARHSQARVMALSKEAIAESEAALAFVDYRNVSSYHRTIERASIDTGNAGLDALLNSMLDIQELTENFKGLIQPVSDALEEVGDWASGLGELLEFLYAPFKPLEGIFSAIADALSIIQCPDVIGFICNLDDLIMGFVDDMLKAAGIPNIEDMVRGILEALGLDPILELLDAVDKYAERFNPLEAMEAEADKFMDDLKGKVAGDLKDFLINPQQFDTPVPPPYPDARFSGNKVMHIYLHVRNPTPDELISFSCTAYSGLPLVVTAKRKVSNCKMDLSAVMRYPCTLDLECSVDITQHVPSCVGVPPALDPVQEKELSEFMGFPDGKLPTYDTFDAHYMCVDLNDEEVKQKIQLLADMFTLLGQPDALVSRSWTNRLINAGEGVPDQTDIVTDIEVDQASTRFATKHLGKWRKAYTVTGVPMREWSPILIQAGANEVFNGQIDCASNGGRTIWVEAVNNPANPYNNNGADVTIMTINWAETWMPGVKYSTTFDPCFSKEWLYATDGPGLDGALELAAKGVAAFDGEPLGPEDTIRAMKQDYCDWTWQRFKNVFPQDPWGFAKYDSDKRGQAATVDIASGASMTVTPERTDGLWENKYATFYRLSWTTSFTDMGDGGNGCESPTYSIDPQCYDDYAIFNSLEECYNWLTVQANRDQMYGALSSNYYWGKVGTAIPWGDAGSHTINCEVVADTTIGTLSQSQPAQVTTQGLTCTDGPAWNPTTKPWEPTKKYAFIGGYERMPAAFGWDDASFRVEERSVERQLRGKIVLSYIGSRNVEPPASLKRCETLQQADIKEACHGQQVCDVDTWSPDACVPGRVQYSCVEDAVFRPAGYSTRIGYHWGSSVNVNTPRNVSCSSPDNFAYISKANYGGAVENNDVTDLVAENATCVDHYCLVSVYNARSSEDEAVGDKILRAEITCICGPGKLPAMKTDGTCNLCPAGKYRNRTMGDCDFCPAGTFSAAGAHNCTLCAPGFYSTRGSVFCSACDSGESSLEGSDSCFPCPPDTYAAANGSANCTMCIPGLTTNGKNKSIGCTPCATGWHRENAPMFEVGCSPCPAGTYYSNASGTIGCDKCAPGYAQPSQASLKCLPCDPGSYQSSSGQTSCKVCPVGKIAPSSGSSNCTSPPAKVVIDWEAESQKWIILHGRGGSAGGGSGGRRRLLAAGGGGGPAKAAGSLCDDWLASIGNLTGNTSDQRVGQIGNGWCNRGPWNVKICDYDGGDCCAATCQRAAINDTSDANATANGTAANATYLPVSCRPSTFECKDPNGAGPPPGYTRGEPPGSPDPSNANDTCNKTDKRIGDGLCQDNLNIKACGYDKGDCCYTTCKKSLLKPGSCGIIDCRDPVAIAGTWADKTPPSLFGVPPNTTVYVGTLRWRLAMQKPVVTASDNDLSFGGNVTFWEVQKAGTGNTVQTITRTWASTDPSKNTAKAAQTVTVMLKDPLAPQLSGVPPDANMTCAQYASGGAPTGAVTASLGGQPVPVTLDADVEPHGCASAFTATNTWTATTQDGLHEAGASQVIRVTHDQGPALPAGAEGAVVACFRRKKFKMAAFQNISTGGGNFSFAQVADDCSPASGIRSVGFVSCGPAPGIKMKPVKGLPNCSYVPETDTLYLPFSSGINETVRVLPSGKNKTVRAAVAMVFSVEWAFEDDCGNVAVVTQRVVVPRTAKDLPPGMPFTGCAYTSVNAVPAPDARR